MERKKLFISPLKCVYLYLMALFTFHYASGMDGCWDSDLLLLCHLPGLPHRAGKLQQIQQQLLQVKTERMMHLAQ